MNDTSYITEPPTDEVILQCENLCYSYHGKKGVVRALENISCTINKGEFIAIVGPSGCGKSTFLNLVSGLLHPESGIITVDGLVHDSMDKSNKNNKSEIFSGIGYMLQHDHLFEWRDIYGNITLGLEIQKKLNHRTLEPVLQMASDYGLEPFLCKKPSELSGGMKQRAALIRTLALNPDILLLDEPFSALDYQTRLMVSADIGKIIRDNGKTAILVTHNLSEAISLADRIFVFSNRPSYLKSEFYIHLTTDDDSPLGYRNAPEFQYYFNTIWEELIND
ncbi:MAG: ABC transporter ATP-binding protein [Eubacteriales bacterium]